MKKGGLFGWLAAGIVAVVGAIWAGALGWVQDKVGDCLNNGIVACVSAPEPIETLYLTTFYGYNGATPKTEPVLTSWRVDISKHVPLTGTYDGQNGITKGDVVGFERANELILTLSGKGYGTAFLKKIERAGAEPVYVGWGFVYACFSLGAGACDVTVSQHKLCRMILAPISKPENDSFLKPYMDEPCIAFPENLTAGLKVIPQN